MRVTTFIAGVAIGALGGMYLADRRSLSHLQSKIQLAGDVVSDVVGMAKEKVMDNAFATITGVSDQLGSMSSQSRTQSHSQSQAESSKSQSNSGSSHAHVSGASSQSSTAPVTRDSINLERVKELIERDPELKRQVDAIIHESSSEGGKAQAEHVAAPSKLDAVKSSATAERPKSSSSSSSHSHH